MITGDNKLNSRAMSTPSGGEIQQSVTVGLLPEPCDSSLPELVPVSIELSDYRSTTSPDGMQSIAGYLPNCCWYPFTPGWREAIEVKQLGLPKVLNLVKPLSF